MLNDIKELFFRLSREDVICFFILVLLRLGTYQAGTLFRARFCPIVFSF
jgi:hypothetical protein